MKAVIMAGGEGTRLRPLSCDLPKPMVPLLNRPLLEHILLLLRRHGVREVALTLCYRPNLIEEYFGDGSRWGMKLSYFREEVPLGTAGSVRQAAEFLGEETFLVLSGDALTDLDLTAALDFHRRANGVATLVLTRVRQPLEYGIVITDESSRIVRFLEKPGWSEVFSDTVNTGIYVLEPQVLSEVPTDRPYDFSKDLFPRLLASGAPLMGWIAEGYWSDIGNLEEYRRGHEDALEGRVYLETPWAFRQVRGGVEIWQEEGVQVDPRAKLIGPVYLGRGTVVEAGAEVGPHAVLGEYCLVRSGASVRHSVLWSRTVVDRGAELRGVVAADGVRFKARSAAFEGAVLGSRVCVEEEATVRPQVKVWPYKQVGEGVTLSSSLIWGQRAPRHLFGLRGISGLANVELTPELVVRLGAAFAAQFPAGSWLGVSADHSSAARLLKGALVSGLLSAGAQVCDLGLLPSPAARFAIPSLSLKGGVHLRQAEEEGQVLVEFLDEQGLTLDRSRQRALENLYYREDFGRVPGGAIGEITCRAEGMERYLQALIASVDRAALLAAGLKVAAAAVPLSLQPALPQLLGQLGCRLQPASPTLAGVAEAVRAGRCQVGFLVDEDGEHLWLVDEGAQIVRQELLLPLAALLALRRFRTAAVPVTASQAVETLAENLGGRVIRTKASLRAVLEPLRAKAAGGTLPSSFDALATAVFLLEALAQEKRALTDFLEEIPEFHQAKAAVPCPWEAKGLVMRALLGQLKGQRVELTDGVKVFHDEGWALVLPDAELPRFNVWGEGRTNEEAQRLVSDYAGRIASFLGALSAPEEAQSR